MDALQIQTSQVIQEDGWFQLRRVTTFDGAEWLLKLPVSDDGHREEALLERELTVLRDIGTTYALNALRTVQLEHKRAVLYESFEGAPLLGEALSASAVRAVIQELCNILSAVHRRGVLLLGVSPCAFLRSTRSARVVLAHVMFAQRDGATARDIDQAWLESPCLAYAAPEIFGAAARALDRRADLYALGGLLYHLLAGRPPFQTADPTELIQCHLTRTPTPLREVAPLVQVDLADAVMRLLAKHPQDRFASVEELELAIARYLDLSRPRLRPPVPPLVTTLSSKHYGHHKLVDELAGMVRDRARPSVVFVEGEPGAGKTTVFREVRRAAVRAHFGAGEFARTDTATPLRGWTSALVELASVVLTSPTSELERWRDKLRDHLGDRAPLIGALAGEWRAILGREGAPPADASEPSLDRLAHAIHRLLACLSEASPVVLIFDDLQWADASSRRLLELVVTAPEPLNLLVLAGVCEHGADGARVARELRDRLVGVDVERRVVPPWTRHEVMCFVTDSLGGDVVHAGELADVLVAKTHGNPFSVREVLRSLLVQNVLQFRVDCEAWCWDQRALQQLPVSANVASLLAHRISQLPDDIKDAVRTCACLGHELTAAEFVAASQRGEAVLDLAVAEGLLVARDATYAFVHDGVLAAARALLAADGCAATHLRIGDWLLTQLEQRPDDHAIFRVASHFNLAARLIEDRATRYARAALDRKAGQLAKQRGAFSQALAFLQAGVGFLCDPATGARALAWHEQPELTLGLHEEAAELALLDGQLPLMTQLCDEILAQDGPALQRVTAYELRIRGLKSEKQFSAAVDTALDILDELGVRFPRNPSSLRVALGLQLTKRRVFAAPVSRLSDLPPMLDTRSRAVARIIESLYSAAYIGRPRLFPLLVLHHVDTSLTHGNEDYSGLTYTALGMVLSATGRFEEGAQLGTIGLGLIERAGAERLKARVFVAYYAFIFPWKNHLRDALPRYREGLESGLAHGDFEYACFLMSFVSLARLHAGDPLPEVLPELERYADKVRSLRQERSVLLHDLLCRLGHGLRDGVELDGLKTASYDGEDVRAGRTSGLDDTFFFYHYLAKMMLGLFLGDHQTALVAAQRGHRYVRTGGFGNYQIAMFLTYESVILLMEASRQAQRAVPRTVKRNLALLRTWSSNAPANFLHKYHLVEAECCRVRDQRDAAATHYEKAIELAQHHGFVHEAGLAQERAGVFCLERGMGRLGREYLREAYRSYERWGADAVARRIRIKRAQQLPMATDTALAVARRAATRFSDALDYRTLLKSSQAISGEILLPRLLERLLESIVEHAGAQRAYLILEKRGELCVEAYANVDSGRVVRLCHEAVETSERLCRGIVHYSARMAAPVVLGDASREGLFTADPYVRRHHPKSVLCTPIHYQGKLIGLVYLENRLVNHVFTEARLEVVSLLAGQAAISISNARLHALELEAQQAKINPHFLFNALSSIADVAISDGKRAESAIVKLAALYRYILTSSNSDLVGLTQELEIVRNYLTLEKLRFGAKLDYSVTLDGDAELVRLPGLLIQPLVENSIRYCITPKLAPGKVEVHAAVHDRRCSIVVQDDGDGGKQAAAGTGFGLRSVQERLALVYGQDFSFAISRSGGYRVEIEVPIRDGL